MIKKIKRLTAQAKTHQGFHRYFANTSWMFFEQMMRMVTGLLVGIWVARYLGPSQFGLFNYAIAFVALFSSISKLGLDNIMVRDLIRHPDQRNIYLGTAFWLKLIGAILMLCIIYTVLQLAGDDDTTRLYIFIIAAGMIFQAFEVVDFYFQSQVLSKYVSICKLIQLFISALLKLYLIYIRADLVWFVMVSLIDQVTLAFTLFLAYRHKNIGRFLSRFDVFIAKKILFDSWPQIMTGLVIMFYMRIDQIMIGQILGEKEVGIYSASVRLSEVFYFIPMIITNSLFPAVIAAKKVNEKLYLKRAQNLFTLLIWLAIVIAIAITFSNEWLVVLLYGVDYRGAGKPLMISIWASIFVFYGVARGRWLISENRQIHGVICTGIGAVTNITLNLILIKDMGIMGAALATCVAQGISAVVVPLFFKKDRGSVLMFINTLIFKNKFN